MFKKEVAVVLMEHLVDHYYHGYSQVHRWGDGEGYCDVSVGGITYKLAQGDRDCSSAIIDVYEQAGYKVKEHGATYTGNMRKAFATEGCFKVHLMHGGKCDDGHRLQRGDILLNDVNHVAMMKNDSYLMQFSISENGTIDGKAGDQLQAGAMTVGAGESNTRPFYDYPWNCCIECIDTRTICEPAPEKIKKKDGYVYRVYNPQTGQHHFTTDINEAQFCVNIGWQNEGATWPAPASGDPVYRLCNPNTGEHLFTVNNCERDHLKSIGWYDEKTGWYSESDPIKQNPVYRLYNPDLKQHHYTPYESERNFCLRNGWNDEGIGFYATEK